MFDLKSFSPVFAAKLGCAVTISVMISACSSEPTMIDQAAIPQTINQVTPEPEQPSQALAGQNSAPRKTLRRTHKKGTVAHHKVRKHLGTAVASATKAEMNGPTPPASPALVETTPPPPFELTIPVPPQPLAFEQTASDQTKDFWAIWLAAIILSSGGLLWFALRRNGTRKGGRRLIFNT